MLRESTQCAILQYAIDAVNGVELEDWQQEELDDMLSDPEKKMAYDKNVADLKAYKDQVGDEEFHKTEFDIGYSYCDPEDYDE